MSVILTQENFRHYLFQPNEVLLLCDRADTNFVVSRGNGSVRIANVVALTAGAHGMALRCGIDNVVPPYDLADYRRFFEDDYPFTVEAAKRWLSELDLVLYIEGINLGELDALYQYWFFQCAAYTARIAETVFNAYPDAERFFVPMGDPFLPAEFFFDTDVAAAVIRHVGEKLGKTVVPIIMTERPLHFAAWGDRRPFMEMPAVTYSRGLRETEAKWRVGIVPAVMYRYERFSSALTQIPAEVSLFSSAWAKDSGASSAEMLMPPPDWLDSVEQTLDSYWQAFLARRARSSLPDYLVGNPYLEAQFAHIIKGRWLGYARYIYQAANYAATHPLDLFIHCDHFTPEGTILAQLYRNRGTRIALTSHARHFFDEPYAPWVKTDIAILTSGSGADIARGCGLWAVHNVGYESSQPPVAPAPKRSRPVVLFLANASEVQFPLIDMKAYLETLSVLAEPPEGIDVVARLKPGIFAEDPKIFEAICGLPQEAFRGQSEISLRECVQQVDCVVGIGLSTSAYLEVIEMGRPLIHVATPPVHKMCPPDFIPDEIGWVRSNDGLWPEIEAVLFDADHRARLLAVQRDYVLRDSKSDISGAGDPLVAALTAILEERPS